mgnify:CR=1 FL=1
MLKMKQLGAKVVCILIAFIVTFQVAVPATTVRAFGPGDIYLPKLDYSNLISEKNLIYGSKFSFEVAVNSVQFEVAQNNYYSKYTVPSSKILLPPSTKVSTDYIHVPGFEKLHKANAALLMDSASRASNENKVKLSSSMKKKFGTDVNIVKPVGQGYYSGIQKTEARQLYNTSKQNFMRQVQNQTSRTYSNSRGTVTMSLDFDNGNLLTITTNNNANVNNRLNARRQQLVEDVADLRQDTRNGIFRSMWAAIAALWNPQSAVLGVGLGNYNNADTSRVRLLRLVRDYINDCNTILTNAGYPGVQNPFPNP